MITKFIVILLSIWSNGEPEIIQFGTDILSQSYKSRENCETRLEEIVDGQNMIKEKGLRGITRVDTVYRQYDDKQRISQQYSCLKVSFSD